MNTVTGKKFNLLKHRAVNIYGAKNLEYSNRLNKKYMVTLKMEIIFILEIRDMKILLHIKTGNDELDIEKEHLR